MYIDPEDLIAAAELERVHQLDDPLKRHHFSCPQTREMVREVADEIEVLLRSGNRASKSTEGAFLGVCLSRGVRYVDGRTRLEVLNGEEPFELELPRVRTPNLGLLLVRTYKQAEESIIRAYKRWIGNHPHRYIKEGKYTTEIRIKPDDCYTDDDEQWSKILVFPAGGALPQGAEAQWCQADEPPEWPVWEEMRSRRGDFPLYRWLTVTPEKRSDWEPMKADFAEPSEWKTEITMSMRDNQFLSPRTIQQLLDTWENDPLKDARINGEYVDMSMASPFKNIYHLLQVGLDAAESPPWEERICVKAEVDDGSRTTIQDAWGTLYIWEKPIPGEKYFIPGDPSLGVDDDEHDPCGCHVYTEGLVRVPGKPQIRQVARYNGFLGSYGLAWLMAALGERYNDAIVDPFMTGGHGGPMMIAFANYRSLKYPAGYTHISKDLNHEQGPGKTWKQPYGHTESNVVVAEKLECLRWAILERAILWPSAATWRCFKDAVLDKHGRLSKVGGARYEDLDLAGRAAYRHFARERPWARQSPEDHPAAKAYRNEFGRRVPVGRGPARRSVFSSQPWSRS